MKLQQTICALRKFASAHKITLLAVLLNMDLKSMAIFAQAYTYFRWVDDLIDSDNQSPTAKLAFLKAQKQLIYENYASPLLIENFSQRLSSEEIGLREVIKYDRLECQGAMQAAILNMLTSIEMDAARRGQLLTMQELNKIQECRTKAYAEGVLTFIYKRSLIGSENMLYEFALACDYAHQLRDMAEDLNFGYINISLEEIKDLGIDLSIWNGPGWREYVTCRVKRAKAAFIQAKERLHRVPLSLRIACWLYGLRHESLLNMICQNNYQLQSNYSLFIVHDLCRSIGAWLAAKSWSPIPHPQKR